MSDVRLSPGVERVSRAPGSPRPPTRRCLFGPVDHEQVARDLARNWRARETEQRARWNFDFANHRPLDGPLLWEPAGPGTPEFYRRGAHPKPGTPDSCRREAHPKPSDNGRREAHPKPGAEGEPESRGRKRSGETAGE
ncbi:hypothetical protein FKM82_028844 [Ascaphus truei]